MAILEWQFEGVPWAVLDIETTGLVPGFDRIIEISVVHLEPQDEEPRLMFDTLVNPRRPFEGDIHGIYEEDVARAPLFGEVVQELAGALAGRVIAAHNAHFGEDGCRLSSGSISSSVNDSRKAIRSSTSSGASDRGRRTVAR